jgi:ribosome-associated protein
LAIIKALVAPGTTLSQLLKYKNIVATGGEAKIVIQAGQVRINKRVETRRGYKLKNGDVVEIGDVSILISIRE